jgi:hypothetical protein
MTDINILTANNNKHFDDPQEYVFCNICAYEGYPYEKIIYRFERLRSEQEEGFIYETTIYDHDNRSRKHIHNPYRFKIIALQTLSNSVDAVVSGILSRLQQERREEIAN